MLVMMLGIGKMLAVINVTFADITYFYKIFTLFLMYGSAIFYRVDRLPLTMQKVMTILNPLYIVISIARECIMGREQISENLKLLGDEIFELQKAILTKSKRLTASLTHMLM